MDKDYYVRLTMFANVYFVYCPLSYLIPIPTIWSGNVRFFLIELFLLKVDIFIFIKQINDLLYFRQASKHRSSALHLTVLR